MNARACSVAFGLLWIGCRPWDSLLCAPCEGTCPVGLECRQGVCISEAEHCGILEYPGGCGQGPACTEGFECFEDACRLPIDIVAGFRHTCVLWPSGRVSCWGSNRVEQSGSEVYIQPAPYDIVGLTDAVQIASHGHSNCVLRKTGDVECWGENAWGELGNLDDANSREPQLVVLEEKARSIFSTYGSNCAITEQGEIRCWGQNEAIADLRRHCVLGDPTIPNAPAPTTVSTTIAFDLLDGGGHHVLGLKDGHVYGWGRDDEGQLRGHAGCAPAPLGLSGVTGVSGGFATSCVTLEDGTARCFGGACGDNFEVRLDEPIVELRAGGYTMCARTSPSNSITCWGNPKSGMLGTWEYVEDEFGPPTRVGGTEGASRIILGFDGHGCFIRDQIDPGVFCWGANLEGRLGNGDSSIRTATDVVRGDFVSITAGETHVCALERSGRILCWGGNIFGQLGRGMVSRSELPDFVPGIDAVAVAAGWNQTCALDRNGDVWCWGRNDHGMSSGSGTKVLSPRKVEGLPEIAEINLGSDHSCAISIDRDLYCWGWNYDGVVDPRQPNQANIRQPNRLIFGVIRMAAGGLHHCLMTNENEMSCYGRDSGALGKTTPIEHVRSIDAGGYHNCAVLDDGHVKCFGTRNGSGELGDGTFASRSEVVTVVELDDVTKISTVFGHTCALRATGEVSCWGQDLFLGRLGIGPSIDRATPVAVPGIFDAVDVTTMRDGGCALDKNGVVRCWGYDSEGQISGHPAYALEPVRVKFGP